ncbi:MAG: S8 family peptidase [Rubrivivax sp.]|nr:S8 family peptidase [Rubrivivax sp.]
MQLSSALQLLPRLALSACLVIAPFAARAGADASASLRQLVDEPTELNDRFILRFKQPGTEYRARLTAIGGVFGERLEYVREMSGGAHVVRLGRRVMRRDAHEVARLLAGDDRIASIEPDTLMRALVVPNDVQFAQQWNLFEPLGGINLPAAWDTTAGSPAIRVAVIDTGVVPHAELAARLVGGYDFISSTTASNDGDGRDADARDPGDHGCNGAASSWHGTHVAGIIGAAGNNGRGIAGVNWVSGVVPVRVLGRCGGYTSDIVDAMRWAAGMAVPGAPANPYPARVQNLSLGGGGACSSSFQTAIDDVTARGTVVVVAAGNDNADAGTTQPASCNGVITVAATTRSGGKAAYSNFGSKVTLAAPGGGAGGGVLSTLNAGATSPGADAYAQYQGPSMAAPHVSGVVSLMLSVNPALTPVQVALRLKSSARAFPTGTGADCTTDLCGAGIVDAAASLVGLVATPAPAPTWSLVAGEGQAFNVSGTQTVRYGSGSNWITREVTGSGTCSNTGFGGDPIFGVVKRCEIALAAGTTWTVIAAEGQAFSVSGTRTVRYGSGTSWSAQAVTGSGACTNTWFGNDPIYGVVKVCAVASGTE